MKTLEHMEAENRLNDPLWRLNNLYWIIDKAGKKSLFQLNWAQEALPRHVVHEPYSKGTSVGNLNICVPTLS